MNHRVRNGQVLATTAACVLLASTAACSAVNERASGAGAQHGPAAELSGRVKGAGASTQERAQAQWAAAFAGIAPDATVEYSPDGSGTGREKFIHGAAHFAGSDAALDATELAQARGAGCPGEALQFPLYIAPIAVAYNVPGVPELRLSPALIAGLFSGEIATWDDPAVRDENPDVDLPPTRVTPVNRSDESGTSENFSAYLAETAGSAWPHERGDIWPITGGEAAKGTSGVISAIESGDGTIGYADAAQIGDLTAARIKVGDQYVAYTPEAAAEALGTAQRAAPDSASDYSVNLDRGNLTQGAYPIVLISYAIACTQYEDPGVARTVKSYLEYAASEPGQREAAAAAGNAPLDGAARRRAVAALSSIDTE